MDQRSEFDLFVGFSCDTLNVPSGTSMRIDDDLKVAPVTKIADPNYVGRVISNYWNDGNYVCSTKYRHRYDKAVAGVDSLTVGPGVHGPDNKIFPFTAPVAGSCSGTVAGPYTFGAGSTDVLSVQVNSDGAVTTTLTSGTLASVIALINATAVGYVASATSDGKITISALNVDDTITIGAPSNHCNTILGLTAAAYAPTAGGKGSPTCLIIKGGDAGDLIEILED